MSSADWEGAFNQPSVILASQQQPKSSRERAVPVARESPRSEGVAQEILQKKLPVQYLNCF